MNCYRGGNQDVHVRFDAFSKTWLQSWTGIPFLAVDYIKHWIMSDADSVAQFRLMKREAESLAKILSTIMRESSREKRVALMKEKVPSLQYSMDQMYAEAQKVFQSGHISQCLKQLYRLMDAQVWVDLSQLPLTRVNTVLHLLGKPLPKRFTRDEL